MQKTEPPVVAAVESGWISVGFWSIVAGISSDDQRGLRYVPSLRALGSLCSLMAIVAEREALWVVIMRRVFGGGGGAFCRGAG